MGGTVIVVSLVAYAHSEFIINTVKSINNYVKNYGFNDFWVHFSQFLKKNDAIMRVSIDLQDYAKQLETVRKLLFSPSLSPNV